MAQQDSTVDTEPKVYGDVYDGTPYYADSYEAGDGSKENPYLISNDMQLAKLAHDVNNGKTFSGKYFKLTKDIDLSQALWTPIGSWNPKTPNFFAGKFDGDGHKISNIHICWTNAEGQEASWGLFSRLAGTAANEAGFACVTNLVVDNACVEKTKGYRPVGSGTIKLGVVAADLTQNAEISNIIIRNSKVTDNEEAYDVNSVYRIGGIVGYINGGYHRIFNISADVSMNMHKNASCKKSGTISGGIGCATSFSKNTYTILPTNIYVHGPGIITNGSNSKGSVIAFYGSSYQKIFPASNKATLYYSHANAVSGSANYNDGTEHEPTDTDSTTGKSFGKTFTEIANAYINDKKLERKTWAYSATSNSFAFSSIALKMERGKEDVLTVVDEEGNAMKGVYDWYVSHGDAEPVKVNTDKLNPFSLPRQTYAQSVYATDGNATTNTVIVNPITLTASLTTSERKFTVNVTNDSEEHLSNEELGLDITYEWYNGTKRLTSIPTSQNIVTRPTDSSKGRKYYCKVTVKSGSSVLLEKYVNVSVVVYLCPAGVTTADGKTYAKGADNLTDDSWGYTPNKPMLTWKGAYSKLAANGSWNENTIVLMGTSSSTVTQNGFCLTQNYKGENLLTYDDWANAKRNNPQLFRNTTITGKWDKDYEGKIEIWGASKGLPIWGDTRFENLTFAMNGGDSYKIIYCQYNNILMDEGIRMTGFSHNSPDYGTIDGAVTNALHIFGGINNDGRFYPLNNPDSIAAYNASMPHGKEGFSISVKSGFYSCISAGGRQSVTVVNGAPAKQNGIMGTPQQPIKCTIDIDIDRTWNDLHNEQRMVTMNDSTKRLSANDYDAGVILAGNHEGAMYADVDIIIRSGKVARVVNGTLGAQTELTLPYGNETYKVPCNTFMGRANITLDPSSSVNNKDEYTDKRVIITELYGGSTGRGHTGNVVVNNPFYGISTVTINGGTFEILPEKNDKKDNILCGIFGAGAGGMNGIGYGDDAANTHTPDQRIPYWNDNRDVMLYGPYATAKDRLVSYHCYNTDTQDFTDVSPMDTRSVIVINGGEFGYDSAPIDGIYGGGSGFMSKSLWTKKAATPSQFGGNVYGNGNATDIVTSLTINGGEFYCQKGVFAGGRGTDYFFSTNAYGGNNSNYKELGKTYGNVELNITGGIFHCPIFGGGYGVADAKQHGTSNVETLSHMARVYGKSNVNIQGGVFFDNVYGGGDMAVVENHGDATNVVISSNADIRGSVFAGGNGRRRRPDTQTFAKDDNMTQHPDSVGLVIGNTNVSLAGSAEQAPYVYGDIFGGGNLAQVSANTNVSVFAGNMAGQIFGGGNGDITNGTVTSADVLGNTNVMLAQDEGDMGGEGEPNENNSFSINVIWNRKWDATNNLFYVWDSNIEDSSDEPAIEGAVYKKDEFFANGKFLNPHNIYGGGNLACNVGTYTDAKGIPAKGTGHATVLVQKGTTPYELLMTEEWKLSYTDNDNPHFSVFGGGYGTLTKVGSTDVTVNVDGDYSKYDTNADNNKQLLHKKNTSALPVFDNLMGIPNFTVWGVLGGGYAGTVADSTKVTVDGNTFVHRVFGGGFGDPASTEDNTTGQIGSNTEVYVRGAFTHGDVFGGGAGLKPAASSSVHFVNVARVFGTTKVDISDDAVIYGNVYGGGDVANVGSVKADSATFSRDNYVNPSNRTTLVNIRGGAIMDGVFAGGKGRISSECADYKTLGGIYGNTCLIIDRPVIHYPYWDDTKKQYLSPSDDANMAHPADDNNRDVYSFFMERIYGGCQNGTVYGNTLMTLYYGSIGHGIYGGGLGSSSTADVEGKSVLTTTSADVTGNTNVFILGGEALIHSYWRPRTRSWEPASIIDGVTYSPQYDHEKLKFKINHNIYAGGNVACKVGGNTHLTMTKSLLHDYTMLLSGRNDKNFFESNEWREIYEKVGSPHFCVFGGGYGDSAIVVGDTYVNVDMGSRGTNHNGMDVVEGEEYKHFLSGYSVMDIVGGGYSGKVCGNTHIIGAGGVFCRRMFGGGSYSSVRSTDVEIKAVDCHDVFGGGLMGDVLKGTTVRIGTNTPDAMATFNNSDIYIHGNIYGGNDVSGYVNVGLNKDGYFKDNGGTGTNVSIYGGHIYGDVYGAGNGNYLYANDRNGNKKVTVNEYYPLNPDDPKSETVPLVYTVPMRSTMPSLRAATDAVKIVNINSWRPLTNRVSIHINGTSATDTICIDGNVYGGGNSATVQKVLAPEGEDNMEGSDEMVGDVSVNIGSHVRIGGVFMGCNGDDMFVTSEDNDFMNMFQKLNGDVDDHSKELNLADSIDWTNNPTNRDISIVYLPTENSKRPLVYPHLIDLYFQPVETDIQGSLTWNGSVDGKGLEDCIIGTFCCGGNRGNMNVTPKTAADNDRKIGNVVDYTFPEGLTITEKIVGGCNNANYDYKGKAFHEGGYLLGIAHSIYPFINLNIRNRFQPKEKDGAYVGGNVYGGCFKSGTIRGDITINMQSDMLAGKEKAKLEKANERLSKDSEYSSLNVYGAGYGMESYVYGNTEIVFGEDVKCSAPKMDGGKFRPCGVADTEHNKEGNGVSANFVYGGGQQGHVIGVTNVDILNGHIFRAVTGGSYSGYVFGSTQVKVGYPTYYHVNSNNNVSGRYVLKRTDQKHLLLENNNGTEKTPTIKQNIYLLTDELVSQGTYEDIVAINNGNGKRKEITAENKDYYFTKVEPMQPSVGWDNVHINIDKAVYGGGYSIAQGSSVLSNNTTVLKFTDKYNLDNAFTTDEELEELKGLPDGTTVGFGGNTLVIIGDNKDSEHITISHQDMKKVDLPEGTDLYGYYYKHYDNDEAVANDVYTYRYISFQDKYFYKSGNTPPTGLNGIRENVFYKNDSEGGIFGDGHLSYAQGFRSADVTGYGFAEHTIDNPKILNTFQRMDIIRLEDNCFSLLGARDYTVNEINKTPYSIARVGEIKMVANDIRLDANGNLEAKTDNDETFTYSPKARNYMGFSNNIHYVGAVTSNVSFRDEKWHNRKGELASSTNEEDKAFAGMSYQDVKQKYIDNYHQNKDNTDADDPWGEFQKRNDGTARNMIGIASGYAMKIQLCQDTYDEDFKKVVEKEHYGPIVGVVEMNLINVRQDEGGGYVYADNNHSRHEGDSHDEDFLETTGNFVFPYQKGSYIVDDCFPTGYYTTKNVADVKVHYWYVTGYHYYYNVNITGYTYQSSKEHPLEFDSDNKDGLTILSGLKSGQKMRIQTWKMRSGHPENKDLYSSDLEYRNYLTGNETNETDRKYYSDKVTDGYRLYVGGAATNSFTGARTKDDKDKETKGFAAQLSMKDKGSNEATLFNNTLPAGLTEDAKIAFKLVDMVDNTNYLEPDYFDKHLSKKSMATLVLKAPAYEEYVSETNNKPIYASTGKLYKKTADGYVEVTSGKLDADNTYYQPQTEEFVKIDSLFMYDTNNKKYEKVNNISNITIDKSNPTAYYVPREYTYTIYLTIEYVQGPTVSGHINVGNCVLPCEMIRVTKNDLVVNADQSFAVSGYYWRIGKREKAKDGTWHFTDTTPWTKENIKDAVAKGYDTFNQADDMGSGLFTGCHYDKTDDYLDIPAYYYMNGYGIQLGVAITGVNDIMQIDMQEADRLTVHNYHRMDPHKAGINLHLAEAITRAEEEGTTFAEPRIYIADQSDLTAFAAFVDSIGNGSPAPRYGAHAQFVLQNDLTMATTPKDGAYISNFAGILHGNGHIINGVGYNNSLFGKVTGNIYNLGLSSGRLSGTTDEDVKPNYHCCFEYAPSGSGSTPVVYRWDGSAYKGYTHDDFRLGKVAYDLNEYYLLARNKADSTVLKYVSDYYANGDYQYACRTDAITGKNTGITYLRIGKLSDIPNYEQVETRHDKTHPVDAPRLSTEDGAAHYVPLFNDNKNGTERMNDYLFWGQSLQSKPADMPSEIASHQLSHMSNRVYRTAAYYGNTALGAFHYNAYSQGSSTMSTYVHDPKTTAIDFTCKDDLAAAMGMTEHGIFYPPVDDNASAFSVFIVKDDAGITQNLLVYTAADNTAADNEAYDVVKEALNYGETTRETLIKGHHVVKTADNSYATSLLHLVERTSDNTNSEGEECCNNDLCVPTAFNVTDHAWYVRKPMAYAEDYYGAWEGICLPFTADKVVASLNGEITHFYGSPSNEEAADPKRNIHTLHHEYWLRSLTSVEKENGVPSAIFQRPDNDAVNGVVYTFSNPFFIDKYGSWLYNKDANPYYAEEHTYPEYPRLAAEKPYIVRFPGERYYEFDLSSTFYNELLGEMEEAQTVTFNAYGKTQADHTSRVAATVPVTKAMQTAVADGYAHNGTFAAVEVSRGTVYGINHQGTAFDDASAQSTVMPFRTYMSVTKDGAMARAAYSHQINISELKGGAISPDAMDDEDNAQNDGIIVRPIGGHRVSVESEVSSRMNVTTAVGLLYRILDIQPGIATYSGFQPGLYIFGKTKVMVK